MTREELKRKKVAVLLGGLSAEREVSLRSGGAVLAALQEAGFNAVGIDAGRDLPVRLLEEKIEIAFIALHGRFGEDGTVQGVLELMGIPYTGSGVLASAVAMHKLHAKRMFEAAGLLTASFVHFRKGEKVDPDKLPFGFPLVVKPAREGSSVGVSIVKEGANLAEAVETAFRYDDEILVERFVKGQEVQVGIVEEKAIGAIEIVSKREFYDYEAKYTDGLAEHIFPARLSPEVYETALQTGLAAHRALGCHGYSRVDLLVTADGDCYVLEVNTLPGMTALSLLPEIAQKGAGLSFGELAERILEGAGVGK